MMNYTNLDMIDFQNKGYSEINGYPAGDLLLCLNSLSAAKHHKTSPKNL